MTGPSPDSLVVCRQCGTMNAAGDQFCGNCGTFLEWSAEPVDGGAGATPAGGPSTPADPSLADLVSPTPAAPVPAPGGGPVAAPLPTPATAAELVRCPTCGTANVAGKTFCLRCGNKLAGATAATRLPLPPRPEPGTGTASPGRTATSVAPAPAAVRRSQPKRESRGGSNWLLIGGAGIAVGAIVVAAALVLGSGKAPPPAAASTAPSASVLVSQAPSASAAPSKPAKTPKPKASK